MADDDIVRNNSGAKQVIWDKKKSIRENIEDNLNLISEGEILPAGFSKGTRSSAVEGLMQLRQALNEQKDEVRFNTYSLSGDDSVVQKLLDDLPSHYKGSPSYLYAVLVRAQQEYTEQEENKKNSASSAYSSTQEKIEKERKELEDKIEVRKKEFSETILSLRKTNDETESQLTQLKNEDLKLNKEIRKKEREILSEKKDIRLLNGEMGRLDSAIKVVEKNIASGQKRNKQYQEMKGLSGSSDTKQLRQHSRSFREKFSKMLDDLLSRTNEQVVSLSSHYTNTVRPMVVEEDKRSKKLQQTATEMQRLIGSIKELQKNKSEKNEGVRTVALNRSSLSTKSVIREPENVAAIRRVSTAGDPKEFEWHDHLNVCTNMERLLNNYINSPGHSPGRVKSAKAVLAKVREFVNGEVEDADRQLLNYIRDQNISSRGFNKEKSLLHAIYRESERAYRSSVVQDRMRMERDQGRLEKQWVKTKEKLAREMDAPDPELDAESRRSEDLSERHDRLKGKISRDRSRLEKLEKEKEKLSAEKEALQHVIVAQKLDLKEKSEALLRVRKDTITLGMEAHSSHQMEDRQVEERFVNDNVAVIDAVGAMDLRIEELHETSDLEEKKVQEMKAESDGQELSVRDAFLRIASKNREMGYVPERIATASVDSLLGRVARFEEKLRTGEVQSTPASKATKSTPHAHQQESDHDEVDHPEERSGPKNN